MRFFRNFLVVSILFFSITPQPIHAMESLVLSGVIKFGPALFFAAMAGFLKLKLSLFNKQVAKVDEKVERVHTELGVVKGIVAQIVSGLEIFQKAVEEKFTAAAAAQEKDCQKAQEQRDKIISSVAKVDDKIARVTVGMQAIRGDFAAAEQERQKDVSAASMQASLLALAVGETQKKVDGLAELITSKTEKQAKRIKELKAMLKLLQANQASDRKQVAGEHQEILSRLSDAEEAGREREKAYDQKLKDIAERFGISLEEVRATLATVESKNDFLTQQVQEIAKKLDETNQYSRSGLEILREFKNELLSNRPPKTTLFSPGLQQPNGGPVTANSDRASMKRLMNRYLGLGEQGVPRIGN